jgi:hypothetical protein
MFILSDVYRSLSFVLNNNIFNIKIRVLLSQFHMYFHILPYNPGVRNDKHSKQM